MDLEEGGLRGPSLLEKMKTFSLYRSPKGPLHCISAAKLDFSYEYES